MLGSHADNDQSFMCWLPVDRVLPPMVRTAPELLKPFLPTSMCVEEWTTDFELTFYSNNAFTAFFLKLCLQSDPLKCIVTGQPLTVRTEVTLCTYSICTQVGLTLLTVISCRNLVFVVVFFYWLHVSVGRFLVLFVVFFCLDDLCAIDGAIVNHVVHCYA